jgi:tripartite-type tricarboxylate transporter receptor subunit TctC
MNPSHVQAEAPVDRRPCLLALAGLGLGSQARARAWPERPVRVLQGFAPGGNADTIARLVGTEMARDWGHPMIVESLSGAAGTLAAAAVARARPDGHTLLLALAGHAVAGALYRQLPYDTVNSFQMVSTITYFPFVVLVLGESKLKSLADLLSAARAERQAMAYGSVGVGSTQHLAGELLMRMAGVPLLHVPYRGDAASLSALLAGEVPFMIAPATSSLPHLKSGRLRALAVTGLHRSTAMPEVPTIDEQGIRGFDVRSWAAWMLPAGAPREVVEALRRDTLRALQVAAVRARLEEMGGDPQPSTPQALAALVAADLQKWSLVIADARIERL